MQEIGNGLIELGIQPGERICILANTRPEWTYADMAATSAGAVVVPIYQTNSPEECLWVISDSEACAIVVEDESQLEKIVAISDEVPNLRTVIIMDPPAGESSHGDGADRRRDSVPQRDPLESPQDRRAQVRRRARSTPRGGEARGPFTFIYTSGTTGPPKGCVLTHGNYAAIVDMVGDAGEIPGDEVIYLYLPLAHSFALLIQLAVFDLGGTLAYFGGDTKEIIPELQEVHPTYLPSVPRVFEKIYTLAHGAIEASRRRNAKKPKRRSRSACRCAT